MIKEIIKDRARPLIGIIGAASPEKESGNYNYENTVRIGYALRTWVNVNGGTLFTGGVEGVGIDAYEGIARSSLIHRNGTIDDRFFTLIPEKSWTFFKGMDEPILTQYDVPEEYDIIANAMGKEKVERVVAGKDMGERRQYVAEIADVLIMINGGRGTVDEAILGLKQNKPVIPVVETGGYVNTIADITNRKLGSLLKLRRLGNSLKGINYGLIHPVKNTQELVMKLDSLNLLPKL